MDLGKNHTAARAQMFSVPPYLFALVIIVLTTWLSDHYRSRSIPLCILCSISALGYLILALTGMLHKSLSELPSEIAELESPDTWLKAHIPASSILPSAQSSMVGMSYAGIMLAAGTIFSIVSLVITWNGNNSETRSGRGTGMVILQVFGQCGPLVGMKLYPAKDGPEYVQGSLVCAGCMGIVGVLVILQRWRLKKENARREMQEKMELAMDGVRPKRRFRYIL
jgi:MFS family permease